MAATGVISRTCQACGTPISVQPWGTRGLPVHPLLHGLPDTTGK